MATFLFTPLHPQPSTLLVLLVVLGVACEDKIVIVELSQLAVKALEALKFLGRREDATTLGALRRETERKLNFTQLKTNKQTKQTNTHTHLIDKKSSHKFPWLEHLHHLPDQIVIGCLGKVGFKAHVGEIWLRSDVDGPVSSLHNRRDRATLQKWSRFFVAPHRKHRTMTRHSRRSSSRSLSIHKG